MNTTMKTVTIFCIIGVVALVGLMGAAAAAGSFTGSQNTGTGMMGGSGHMNGQMGGQSLNGHAYGMMGAAGHMGMMNGTGVNCQNLSGNQCNVTQNADGTFNCSRYQDNLA
ncbi:MAG TPA: hypothetical protein VGK23_00055 [Methanomassiliicoccales archaeon]|jgi:hypothetical protein